MRLLESGDMTGNFRCSIPNIDALGKADIKVQITVEEIA